MTTTSPPARGAVTPHESQLRRERQLARRRRTVEVIQGQGLLLVFVAVFVIMWISSPYFFTINNLATAAGVVSVLGVMAVAETMVIIMGEIDVSIGSVMALSSVLIGKLVGYGLNPWVASLVAALAAAGIGEARRDGAAGQRVGGLSGVGRGHHLAVPVLGHLATSEAPVQTVHSRHRSGWRRSSRGFAPAAPGTRAGRAARGRGRTPWTTGRPS
jgi:hypothetical protein